jgi:hypothetical protein
MRFFLLIIGLVFLGQATHAREKYFAITDTSKPIRMLATTQPVDSNVLVVINGVVAGTIREIKKDISTLFPTELIESIHVWKDAKAIEKFGERGKHGVIEFVLKKEVAVSVGAKITETDVPSKHVIYEKVEIEAKFPGGDMAWRKFLERNLNAGITADNGAPAGTYTAVVQFVVDTDGSIYDMKALTSHGYGIEGEVLRVMSKSPKWEPAILNGRQVKAYRKQPVTFVVMNDFEVTPNIIEAGKETEIEIDYYLDKKETLEAAVSEGTIKPLGDKKFLIKSDKPGKLTLTFFVRQKNRLSEIGKTILEVK